MKKFIYALMSAISFLIILSSCDGEKKNEPNPNPVPVKPVTRQPYNKDIKKAIVTISDASGHTLNTYEQYFSKDGDDIRNSGGTGIFLTYFENAGEADASTSVTYYYDDKGNLTHEMYPNLINREYTNYQYDDKGNWISREVEFEVFSIPNEWDSDVLRSATTRILTLRLPLAQTIIGKGIDTRKIEYYADGKIKKSEITLAADNVGHLKSLVQERNYDKDGIETSYATYKVLKNKGVRDVIQNIEYLSYKFNDKGYWIERVAKYLDRELIEKRVLDYFKPTDKDPKDDAKPQEEVAPLPTKGIKSIIIVAGDKVYKTFFDKQGQKTSSDYLNGLGQLISSIYQGPIKMRYKYDSKHNVVEEAIKDILVRKYSDYKFDDRGNWIERKVASIPNLGENKGKTVEGVEKREITYREDNIDMIYWTVFSKDFNVGFIQEVLTFFQSFESERVLKFSFLDLDNGGDPVSLLDLMYDTYSKTNDGQWLSRRVLDVPTKAETSEQVRIEYYDGRVEHAPNFPNHIINE